MLGVNLNTAKKVSCAQFVAVGLHRLLCILYGEPSYVFKSSSRRSARLISAALPPARLAESNNWARNKMAHSGSMYAQRQPHTCTVSVWNDLPQSTTASFVFCSGSWTKGALFRTGRLRMGSGRCQGGSANMFSQEESSFGILSRRRAMIIHYPFQLLNWLRPHQPFLPPRPSASKTFLMKRNSSLWLTRVPLEKTY